MRNALLVSCLALLSACAGGGGDPAPAPVPTTTLLSKADAQRELANAAAVAISFASAPAANRQSAPASFRPKLGTGASWQLPQRRLPAEWRAGGSGGGVTPAAAQTTNCSGGGSETYDSGAKSRGFSYFPTTQMVNWRSYSDSLCSQVNTYQDGSSTTYTSSGFEEVGDAASEYSYGIEGAGGTPGSFSITDKDAAGATTFRLQLDYLGTGESRTTQALADYRLAMSFGITQDSNGQTTTISETLGGAAPMRITASAAGAVTIDGDLYYSSNLPGCAGGAETFETLQPITVDANGYPNGGELKVSSGDAWVIAAFNADGSAYLTFSDGSSASLTAAEVQASVDGGGCTTPQV